MAANRISGVFSSRTESIVGTGTTIRQTEQKTFWFAQENEDGGFEVQPLNSNNVPSGPKIVVEREKFLNDYHPEPDHYLEVVRPSMEELEATVKRGEEHRRNGEGYSAEYEFGHAIDVDEENVRANFGLGLTYLERGETNRAEDVFRRLVGIKDIYQPEHKHLFNDFGMKLRKNGMIEEALEYYHKAEELSKEDENLCMNIARAYYEKGGFEDCVKYLKKALKLNPDLEEGAMFWDYLKGSGYVSEEDERDLNVGEVRRTKPITAQSAEEESAETKPEKEKAGPIKDLEIDF
jgi:tetratricopeptide (TPR) repeat protein